MPPAPLNPAKPPSPLTSPQLNSEPPPQIISPLCPSSLFTGPLHAPLPPHTSPPSLLSIPLVSRQAARMAGIETFTDGSTGKFSHPPKEKRFLDSQICILITSLCTMLPPSILLSLFSLPLFGYTVSFPFPFSIICLFYINSKAERSWSNFKGA